ncbi:MAG: LacI family DNA-binding transcriptional regulator [Spirochaetales bacterium]|nr:LacI family DNA-binding transcriptional regulator [Spirochaetales bacterium]
MKKKISMGDVARKADVSVSTVSRVINNQAGISTDTRTRILSIAKEMNLIPNIVIGNTIANRTGNIGLIGTKTSNPPLHVTSSHLTVGILEESAKIGYHILTNLVNDEGMKNALQLPIIQEHKVDGIILIGPKIKSSFILDLYNSNIPLILIDNCIRGLDIDCILYENQKASYSLTHHLIKEHKHKKIVFLSGPDSWISNKERETGYLQAMKEASLKAIIFYMPDTTISTGREAAKKALHEHPDLTAIVAVNDAAAIGAIQACKTSGYSIPKNISVTGFDDIHWAEFHDPPLTTVKTFVEEMGRQAVRRLLDLINHDKKKDYIGLSIRVGTRPVYRRSCGCSE